MRKNVQPAAIPLTPARAAILGLIQGPAELLPISSSAHLGLAPKLAGWEWGRLDAGLRKDLEVALHAGGAIALTLDGVAALANELRDGGLASLPAMLTAVGLPALVGLLAEETIEEVSSRESVVAAALALGAAAMIWVDNNAARRAGGLRLTDGLALGLAQSAALIPGVSRSGAALIAARGRGFGRRRSERISAAVGLPVLLGATGLKAVRVVQRRHTAEDNLALVVGAVAALGSTLLAKRMMSRRHTGRALWPTAAYRVALAALILAHREGGSRPPAG